jgi:alpha-tubulin suppressor-like RCC1 family protein
MPKLTFAIPRKIYIPPPQENINLISAGENFILGITNFGKIKGIGYNYEGQLGDNSIVVPSTPVSIGGFNKTFCKISVGFQHSISLDQYGRAWGWGLNSVGQLGNNSITSQRTPVSVLGAVKTFCHIGAGLNFSTGIDKNGRAWSWGLNSFGQLGDNSITTKRTPISVLGAVKTFCNISTGNDNTLVIDKNGRVWGWGRNQNGSLGDNTALQRLTPVSLVGAIKTFCKISAGYTHTLGVDKNNRLWGWGNNGNGQIGNNSTTSQRTPVSVLGAVKTFCKISAGNNFSLGIDKNGRLWSWGNNLQGQLGDNSITSRRTPVSVLGTVKTFCEISAKSEQSYALDKDGNVWGWGTQLIGEFGQNTTTPRSIQGSNKTFCNIGAGFQFSLGVTSQGRAWGWGRNAAYELGDGSNTSRLTPVSVLGAVKTFCNIFAGGSNGGEFSIGITNLGRLWGWGNNTFGQLGDNSVTGRATPVSVAGATKTFCRVGQQKGPSVMALDQYGRAWGWGNNSTGQLGDNSITSRRTPVSVLGAVKTFCKISGGSSFSLALDKYGRAWAWGTNANGQLGDNSITSRRTPVSVLGATKTFCEISGGVSFTLALDKNGRLWSWGINTNGQLGDNSITSRRTPVSVLGTVKTFCQINAGNEHTVAIDKNGRLWSWGLNTRGQLGNNSTLSRLTPVSVLGAVKTFCKVNAGSDFTISIDKNGKVWAWGSYFNGQLGINLNTKTPILISNF